MTTNKYFIKTVGEHRSIVCGDSDSPTLEELIDDANRGAYLNCLQMLKTGRISCEQPNISNTPKESTDKSSYITDLLTDFILKHSRYGANIEKDPKLAEKLLEAVSKSSSIRFPDLYKNSEPADKNSPEYVNWLILTRIANGEDRRPEPNGGLDPT